MKHIVLFETKEYLLVLQY